MILKMHFLTRFSLLVLIVTSNNLLFAQTTVNLPVEWQGSKKAVRNGVEYELPNIKDQGYLFNVPNFYHIYKVKSGFEYEISDLKISTITATKSDINYLEKQNISLPNSIVGGVTSKKAAKEQFLVTEFKPFFLENGTVKKISNIQFTYSNKSVKKPISAKSFATNSVLMEGSGKWYKVSVRQDGVYKIDAAFLETVGLYTPGMNSNEINIFGNGEGFLPVDNSVYRTDDLAKNAIKVVDGGDGTFDQGDYILFYGFGPHRWYTNGTAEYERRTNTYCDDSYYFINVNGNDTPLRITDQILSPSPSNVTVNEMDFRISYEKDNVNLVKAGQRWYGELFDTELSYQFDFVIPGINKSQPAKLKMAFATNKNSGGNSITAKINGTTIDNIGLNGIGEDYSRTIKNVSYIPTTDVVGLNLSFNRVNPSVISYLDFITINAKRQLSLTGNQMNFSNLASVASGNITKFFVDNMGANASVWEITDRQVPKNIPGSLVGTTFDYTVETDTLREFVAIDNQSYFTPTKVGSVGYQNLHSLPQADYIILTHPTFVSQANRLANLHRDKGLLVHVVTPDKIYNEFSSGMQDPTAIRFFVKMFYDRGMQNSTKLPKHLLLFGDGVFDPKNRVSDQNFILTYQVETSENHISALVTDDYFGMLDDDDAFSTNDLLDIGIGRLLISSTTIAVQQVDKIQHYMKNGSDYYTNPGDCDCLTEQVRETFGDWRLKYVQIADDEENGYFIDVDAERQVEIVENYRREMNVDKLYLDAYQQVSTAGGQRFPDAVKAINDRIRRGALVINYIGHGGEVGVAEERVITVPQILNWKNAHALPLLVTATCEFTKYDDPDRVSAGEWASLSPKGGAIALMTTSRSVYFSVNSATGYSFFEEVFRLGSDSLPRTFGEIIQSTKNNIGSVSDNKRSFTLIGDPALRIALPQTRFVLDSMYRIGSTNQFDTIRALDKIVVVGHAEDVFGNQLTGFNGLVSPTIYDKPKTLTTLGQDDGSPLIPFQLQKNALYKGQATVKNGTFNMEFIVPKDIDYNFGNGKVSIYGHNNVVDGMGRNELIVVGGINPNGIADDRGPDIDLFLNDESFVNGGLADENPIFIAKVFDENGINSIGNGIGHDITLILDGETSDPLILNDYYLADLDTYQSGSVRFNLSDLEVGRHVLTFKVWDVNNNSSEASLEFVVQEQQKPELLHVLNYPNPFTTATKFFFEHNQINQSIEAQIQVFTVSGRLVKTINQYVNTSGYRSEGINWDGLDDFGDQLAKGVYIYRLKIETEQGKAEKIEKLVILK
jgi:hypothetical protein